LAKGIYALVSDISAVVAQRTFTFYVILPLLERNLLLSLFTTLNVSPACKNCLKSVRRAHLEKHNILERVLLEGHTKEKLYLTLLDHYHARLCHELIGEHAICPMSEVNIPTALQCYSWSTEIASLSP